MIGRQIVFAKKRPKWIFHLGQSLQGREVGILTAWSVRIGGARYVGSKIFKTFNSVFSRQHLSRERNWIQPFE